MEDLQKLRSLLRRTEVRLRIQLMLERATTFAVVAVALWVVALFFYKSRSIEWTGLMVSLGLGGALVAGGALWGLVAPLHARYMLKRLDLANDTRDALGSAFDFLARLPAEGETPQTRLMRAQVRQTRALLERIDHKRGSRFRRPRDLPALGVISLACVAFFAMSIPVHTSRASIPPQEKPPKALHIDGDVYQEAVDNLKDVEDLAKHLKDRAMLDFLREYKQLLDALKRGELTREQFEQRYQALKEKYFQGLKQQLANQKQIQEQMHEVGKELAKNKLTKALGEALKKDDLDAARRELAKLADLLKNNKLSPWQKKELAKAIEKAAKVLQNKDAKQLEDKIRQQQDKLQKQVDEAKRQLERLQRRLNQAKDPQQRQSLKRQFQKQQRNLQQLQRQMRQLAQQQRQLQRLSRSMQDLAKQLQREKMDAQTRAALEKLMQELSRYQNQSARGNTRGQAQLTLKQLKELLKRLRSQRGRQKGALSDYLNRARQGNQGQKPCPTCHGSGKKPGGKGPCPSCGGGGRMGGITLQPGAGGRQGGLTRSGGNQGNKQGGNQGGSKWGTAHRPDTVKGRATELDAKHQEHKAKGQQGAGPSEAQVFQGGADKGFSSQSYRRVYVQYRKIWQQVLNQEEIPPGYRYLIQRYFRLIKPR